MNAQRERARAAGKFGTDYNDKLAIDSETDFHGYDTLAEASVVIGLFSAGQAVESLAAGQDGQLVLANTPFYAESGGQVGDTGYLKTSTGVFRVTDTQKQGKTFIHVGQVESGNIQAGAKVSAEVDSTRRNAIILNHSATHLMHAALRQVLGQHVEQKGSLVNEERLRFDFSHPEAVTAEQIAEVEVLVNSQIRANAAASARLMDMESAKAAGAMALFGEKYGDVVRVMQLGFSTELCGGCHVERTGDIGLFKIVSEGGVAAGIRRIEAVTGANALAWLNEVNTRLSHVARLLKSSSAEVLDKTEALVQRNRALEKELEQLKGKMASQAGSNLADQALDVAGIKVLAANLEGADPKSLRDTVDQLKNKLGKAVIILSAVAEGKVALVAGVTKDETSKVKAGDLLDFVASQLGGKGGGRPDLAQGGGSDVAALPQALASVPAWVAERL